jgi:hypothetical protein
MPFLLSVGRVESLLSAVTWCTSLGVPDDKAVTFIFRTDDVDYVFQFTQIGLVARRVSSGPNGRDSLPVPGTPTDLFRALPVWGAPR